MTSPYLAPAEVPGAEPTQGQTFILVCPVCGDRNVTTGSPSDDGTTYAVPMEGDCRHRWSLQLRTENGQTVLFASTEAA